MSSRTYYDILGVSRDATLEEITSAKNALAKVYHLSLIHISEPTRP